MPGAEVPFLDTNIVLYSLSLDETKRLRAIELLQVINGRLTLLDPFRDESVA